MTRALVTGASGFIGANLVRRLLADGVEVHVIIRDGGAAGRLAGLAGRINARQGDLGDRDCWANAFRDVRPDVVFHLATPRGADRGAPARLVGENVAFALALTDELRRSPDTRVVAAGSSLEYGVGTAPHREDEALDPSTWHGVGKVAATMIFRQAHREFGARLTELRLFHVYGPWESPHRLLPSAIRAAFDGTSLPLTSPGSCRDWVHVDDVVDSFLAASMAPSSGESINIGTGVEASNEEIVDLVSRLAERPIARDVGAFRGRASDAAHRRADPAKARESLGWVPRRDLETGIAEAIAWFRSHPEWLSAATRSPAVC